MLTRREFGKYVGSGALALGIGEVSMGLACPFSGSIFSDIVNYVPIGIQAFDNILSLLDPALATALAVPIKDVQAGFAALAGAVTAYENAPEATKSTLIGKVTDLMNAVIESLQQFWSQANLPDGGLATTIEGVLQLVISTLAAFLPLVGGTLKTHIAHKHATLKTIPIIPRTKAQLKQKQFKKDCNAIFTKGGYHNVIY